MKDKVATVKAAVMAMLIFSGVLLLIPALSQQDYSGPCNQAGCHDLMGKRKVVHPALDPEDCSTCHETTGEHRFKLTAEGDELCMMCHEPHEGKAVHAAIDAGGCVACHDPHQSEYPGMMRKPVPYICWDCHDALPRRIATHNPVALGQCQRCHNPHASDNESLLEKPMPDICRECHKELTLPIPLETIKPIPPHGRGPISEVNSVHSPVESGDCLTCHDAHSADLPGMLLLEQKELCVTCHEIERHSIMHRPVAKGTCTRCHSPHESPFPSLLRDDMVNTCGQCHLKTVSEGKFAHSPVEEGECTSCHNPHGSDQRRLLVEPARDLCVMCHEPMTGHPVVHGAVILGRCSTCHNPHRSDTAHLVRDSRVADTCFRCHYDDVSRRKFVHAPVAEGECTTCHNSHGAANEKLLVEPGKRMCYMCHESKEEGQFVHEVINTRGCTACHDPHGTKNPLMLIDTVNGLCVACHPAIVTRNHIPLQSITVATHPLEGFPDPSRPDRNMSCLSCHSPHSAPGKSLLLEGGGRFGVCGRCHKELGRRND